MSLSPCHQLAKDLKATLDARMLGRKAQSFGNKGRQMTYTDTPTPQLIAYYNQVRKSCPDALTDPELIEVLPLDQPTTTRGRPGVMYGRGWV